MDAEVQKTLEEGYKRCSTCKRSKPISDFNYRRDTPDNLQYHCASCGVKRNARYYKTNPSANRGSLITLMGFTVMKRNCST